MSAHADQVAEFYHRLIEKDVPADVSGALALDFNIGIINGNVSPPSVDKSQLLSEVAEAAAAKAEKRKRQLEEQA